MFKKIDYLSTLQVIPYTLKYERLMFTLTLSVTDKLLAQFPYCGKVTNTDYVPCGIYIRKISPVEKKSDLIFSKRQITCDFVVLASRQPYVPHRFNKVFNLKVTEGSGLASI